MGKLTITLGVIGVACLVASLIILARVRERCAFVENESARTAHAVAVALVKYEQVLRAIERRQTLLETAFTRSENLYLTVEQLKGYNHFRAPQHVFVESKSEHVPTAQGGGD